MPQNNSRTFAFALLAGSLLALPAPAFAQWGNLLGTVKKRVEKEVERTVRGEEGAPAEQMDQDQPASSRLQINEGFDFTPGTTTLVQDDFADVKIGAMPAEWKTNGSGSVVSVNGLPGKWLSLQKFATYKLETPPQLPANFTIEFDIVVAADQTRDLSGMPFGFTANNSVRSYVQDAYNDAGLAVVNTNYSGNTTVSSSVTDYFHSLSFNYSSYANRVMHVSIAVKGDQMQVYFDRTKIADARLFNDNPVKYFFISAPINMNHGANVLFGNFRIAS
ncbi:hypothetical protein GRI39_06715 [Altererythrobacter indicus]|uniref:Uncharacterized protein n=1 Tax=Altericroceibacterium indicum TaxID=374177 RepID=A0A845A7R8_9SPHN|nr:hypothetical protein [Altericroceibacterium indicum]MXP25734.1 hypothetical protein [Altericroceibacterium indicum]